MSALPPKANGVPRPPHADDAMASYLARVRLEELDLRHIDLGPTTRPGSVTRFARALGERVAQLLAQVPPWVWRVGALVLFVAGAAFLLLATPREAQWQGSGYANSWFVSVGLAVSTGILGGRWLIMQAEAARARQTDAPPPWRLPPWFKWVSLALLCSGGGYATFGHLLWGAESSNFSMTGVGFSVGIGAAIWIARRFDEWEAQWRSGERRRESSRPK